jgi:LPXTG-motif cell wall-anchored protein
MSAGRHRIACLVAVAALAAPSAAWAQGAGDDQYQDPFGDEQEQAEPTPEPTPEPEAPASSDDAGQTAQATPAPTAAASQTAPAAAQLPRTGDDAGLLALSGAVLLASGVALRRRVS